jgi:hypothetical protein
LVGLLEDEIAAAALLSLHCLVQVTRVPVVLNWQNMRNWQRGDVRHRLPYHVGRSAQALPRRSSAVRQPPSRRARARHPQLRAAPADTCRTAMWEQAVCACPWAPRRWAMIDE